LNQWAGYIHPNEFDFLQKQLIASESSFCECNIHESMRVLLGTLLSLGTDFEVRFPSGHPLVGCVIDGLKACASTNQSPEALQLPLSGMQL